MPGYHLRTVEEIFGQPLPVLSVDQQQQLIALLEAVLATMFMDVVYRTPVARIERKVRLVQRLLLEGRSSADVGREFGITRSRVSAIRKKTMRMLRHPTRTIPLRGVFHPRQCADCAWSGLLQANKCPECGSCPLVFVPADDSE